MKQHSQKRNGELVGSCLKSQVVMDANQLRTVSEFQTVRTPAGALVFLHILTPAGIYSEVADKIAQLKWSKSMVSGKYEASREPVNLSSGAQLRLEQLEARAAKGGK